MSRLLSSATFEETFTQQWPWGRYEDYATVLDIYGGGSAAWTPAYAPSGGPGLPDVGAFTLTATADATGVVYLEHVEGTPGTPAWLPDRQARAEWWVRHPDVVPPGLAYVVDGVVRDTAGVALETLELYRDDAPVPGWSLVTIDWPAREDALYANIFVQHKWTGTASPPAPLVAGDTIGLAAAMLVEPSSWDRGYFDGDTPNGDGVAYFDFGTYAEARVTRNYTAEPELILDYAYSRNAPTIVHDVLARGVPDVTVRPVGTRAGTLNMFCLTREQALEVETVNRQQGSIYLDAFEEDQTMSMNYVVTGTLTVTWNPDFDRWVVAVPYREVPL